MSRMKHLLRKLHIGSGAAGATSDHHRLPHNRLPPTSSSSSSTSTSTTSSSQSTPSTATASRTGAVSVLESQSQSADFSFLEEEFQVQLALAISASDPDAARRDPDTAQIDAAKRISLGCSASSAPVDSLVDILSLQYWNYHVINYDEKVVDGFYDVYGIMSNPSMQGKMPPLVDLQAISLSDDVDYEVVLVNRVLDRALQQLERKAVSISVECRATELGPVLSGLVQKLADLVVESMGGPVSDADDMLRRWTVKSYELRNSLNSIVLPLGLLEVGLSRHRALLFKVLADRVDLPCRLVKGSYYTGTDEGAVNLIKIAPESEYIIDLMGAPGALIPAEISNDNLQPFGLDTTSCSTISRTTNNICTEFDNLKLNSVMEGSAQDSGCVSKVVCSGSVEALRTGFQPGRKGLPLSEKDQTERFEHDFGKLRPSLGRSHGSFKGTEEPSSSAQDMKVKDVSKYVISAAQNPEFAQKLHAVLLESGALPPPDLFSNINPFPDMVDERLLGQTCQTGGLKTGGNFQLHLDQSLPYMEHSPVPFVSQQDGNILDLCHGMESIILSSNDKSGSSRDFPFPCVPNTSNIAVASSTGSACEWLMVQADSSTVLPRAPYVEKIQDPYVPFVADSGCKQLGPVDAEQSFQAKAVTGKKYAETRGGTCSTQCKESTSESVGRFMEAAQSDSHIPYNKIERTNSMLDTVAEWEIHWEDLQIGERIGLGSYGEVYRADWNGTEVAVKKFLDQDFSGDALQQFKCEIEIMLRLRHPNVVLFMGAVTRPPNLSILTEFLPRGSLYRLLHRPNTQLDEKRRLRMALDVAKGMNYLHTSHPTIVHRDLKSPNLLVDKNWVVKVCDFGLSRLKHHTFLSSKSTAGTPEWMAPEVLRNELANEKCDVYSFGVILWELATLRMPWGGMNPMQVVGAVGFQNRRLEIPKDVDPMVAQIIYDCWQSDPSLRPSFAQLMTRLKQLNRLVVEVP